MAVNQNLNLNPARPDKFFMTFGDFPSIPLLTPEEATQAEKLKLSREDKDFFHIAIQSAKIPAISLGEVKTQTMFTPVADTDMNFTFDTLTVNMKMDENFILYKMLVLWMFLIKHPETASLHGMKETFDRTNVNAILTKTDNFNQPIISFEFYELRPLGIPTIDLDYNSEGEELIVPITYSYSYFLPKTSGGEDYKIFFEDD